MRIHAFLALFAGLLSSYTSAGLIQIKKLAPLLSIFFVYAFNNNFFFIKMFKIKKMHSESKIRRVHTHTHTVLKKNTAPARMHRNHFLNKQTEPSRQIPIYKQFFPTTTNQNPKPLYHASTCA